MKLKFKIIVGLLLSLPVGFFLWLLILNQWNEFVVYGNVEESVLINREVKGPRGSSAEFGGETRYDLKVINSKEFEGRVFTSYIESLNSGLRNKTIEEFKGDIKEGDTLIIKIMNKENANILKWKNLQINKQIDYFSKVGEFLIILGFMFFIFFVYYNFYKIFIK